MRLFLVLAVLVVMLSSLTGCGCHPPQQVTVDGTGKAVSGCPGGICHKH